MDTSILEIKEEKTVVLIKDSAVIDSASQIYELFSKAFESKRSVILDISQTTECDVTFIQLICSFCFSMIKEGREFELKKNLPDYFQKNLKSLGFQNRCKCTRMNSINCIFIEDNTCTENSQESVS